MGLELVQSAAELGRDQRWNLCLSACNLGLKVKVSCCARRHASCNRPPAIFPTSTRKTFRCETHRANTRDTAFSRSSFSSKHIQRQIPFHGHSRLPLPRVLHHMSSLKIPVLLGQHVFSHFSVQCGRFLVISFNVKLFSRDKKMLLQVRLQTKLKKNKYIWVSYPRVLFYFKSIIFGLFTSINNVINV